MTAGFPVAATNRQAASTFGPIDPAANGIQARAVAEIRRIGRCVGLPQSE